MTTKPVVSLLIKTSLPASVPLSRANLRFSKVDSVPLKTPLLYAPLLLRTVMWLVVRPELIFPQALSALGFPTSLFDHLLSQLRLLFLLFLQSLSSIFPQKKLEQTKNGKDYPFACTQGMPKIVWVIFSDPPTGIWTKM